MSITNRRSVFEASLSDANRYDSILKETKLLDEEIYELANLEALYKHPYLKPISFDSATDDNMLQQHYLRAQKVLLAKGFKLKWKNNEDETKSVNDKPIVTAIEYVLNPLLLARYSRALLKMSHDNLNLSWLFHGTSTDKMNNICLKGFYKPGQVSYESNTKNKGYYGYGCYFSHSAKYAYGYSAKQNSNQILLCRTICGKIRTVDMCLGATRTSGYDSHISRCSLETVIFHVERILPMYIIHLEPMKNYT